MTRPHQRALVVDDDRAWQDILGEILSDAGMVVDTAANLESAALLIHNHPHRLAVVDLSLLAEDPNNQDGLKILDAIRRSDPGCSAVLLTGFATVELAVSAIKTLGAYTCLQKENFQRRQFRELVSQILTSAPPLQGSRAPDTPARGGLAPQYRAGLRAEKEAFEEAPPKPLAADLALVVEDDAGWRAILGEILKDAEYQVRLCGSYGEALGCLRREKYHLAIIDLSLRSDPQVGPAKDLIGGEQALEGFALLEAARKEDIPTIVVSGISAAPEIERAYREQGVFAFHEKQTFNRHIFTSTVREVRVARRQADELHALTGRELEIFQLLAQGQTNQEIANSLFVSVNTVKRHLKSIFHKLGVHTRSAAAAKAAQVRRGREWSAENRESREGNR